VLDVAGAIGAIHATDGDFEGLGGVHLMPTSNSKLTQITNKTKGDLFSAI
jgi:hypothetical protein